VVKVRILSIDSESGRIVASIRQAGSNFKSDVTDITGVEIGNIVEGIISAVHRDNVVLTLQPTQVRALISLKNLANHHSKSLPQLRTSLVQGTKLEGLVVVSRNPEKGFVIVANRPKAKASLPAKNTLSMSTIAIGQMVGGRVTRHVRNGALVKLNAHTGGILHPTDVSDNYEAASALPAIDSVLKAIIIGIDDAKNQLVLSTRHSRMYPDRHKPVVDREIKCFTDLKVGETIRGFIKSIAEHGLFVNLGPDVDARVQIKELFDEVGRQMALVSSETSFLLAVYQGLESPFPDQPTRKGSHPQVCFLKKLRSIIQSCNSIDVEDKKVEMSFRSENLIKNSSVSLAPSDLHEGQKVDGRVKKIEDYGLFLEIDGSKLTGLCHKSEVR
jgi:rRNA biogenesis protein RRP5